MYLAPFGVPSLEECKELALQYKTSRDEKLFLRFLLRFEKFGYYVWRRVKTRCSWMQSADMEDVRQTVLMGILNAFTSIPEDAKPSSITARVRSYVKVALNSTFLHRKHEMLIKVVETTEEEMLKYPSRTYNYTNLDTIMEVQGLDLSSAEKDLIEQRFIQGKTLQDIGESIGTTWNKVDYQIKKILKKLRKKI